MKNFRLFLSIFLSLFILTGIINGAVYNQDGDFSVSVDSLKKQIYNDNINTQFKFSIENKKSNSQSFKISIPSQSGWDIKLNSNNFRINRGVTKEVLLNFVANNNFDYSNNVVAPNVIQISQKDDYSGNFDFPIFIIGDNENVSLKLKINIKKKEVKPVFFLVKASTETLSPILPFKYSIKAENLVEDTEVFVRVEFGNQIIKEFSNIFSPDNNFKFFQEFISSDFAPGVYNSKITIRIPQEDGKSVIEWNENSILKVDEYKNIIVSKNSKDSFFKDVVSIELKNNGNLNSNYVEEFKVGTLQSYLIGSNNNFKRTENGIKFDIPLEKGEEKIVEYTINYISLYIILLVLLLILVYVYVRKNSNPLEIETSIYDIKKVIHEGVKEMKFKIGFENYKADEIEDLKIIFRMPTYLNIKENSFTLTEPNHVLKGKSQYKLIWNFKRFEKEDTRILGFSLINPRGILGDIKLPDLEFEVKIDGKIKKYYASFPIIRG